MNPFPLEQLEQVLTEDGNVAFAYIYGSAAGSGTLIQGSDLDMGVYFFKDPDLDGLYEFIKKIEDVVGEDRLDLLVLNGCEDYILRNEVLRGKLLYCKDSDLHAAFFSWTLRMYEDQRLRAERCARST